MAKTTSNPVIKLTKFVYGNEISRKKTPFGLLNNQVIADSIIKSAGWFNQLGQKLGAGDLSLREMGVIQQNIAADEMFFVLSEADSMWGIPSQFDKSEPGFCYVAENATWIIGRSIGIVRVRDDIAKSEETIVDGIRYSRIPNKAIIAAFKQKVARATPAPAADDPDMKMKIPSKTKSSSSGLSPLWLGSSKTSSKPTGALSPKSTPLAGPAPLNGIKNTP
jgi:hypothetical protein